MLQTARSRGLARDPCPQSLRGRGSVAADAKRGRAGTGLKMFWRSRLMSKPQSGGRDNRSISLLACNPSTLAAASSRAPTLLLPFFRSSARDGGRAGSMVLGAGAAEVLCTLPSAARLVSLAKC